MKNIFISSTFRDMQAERDLVQERVLPALREEAKKYGDNVGVIDLRWGVDTSTLETDEGSAKVLKVCLDEIDRSHPYMLIFLGERYGWIPDGSLIESAVRKRGDKYVTDDFEKSVTALEIEYGALSEQYGDLKHCIVCFREPVAAEMDSDSRDIYAERNEKGREKLEELKARIRKELGDENRLISYTCKWDESAQVLKDFTANGQPLEDVLTERYIEMFQPDWEVYKNLSWQEKEQLGFQALMESKLRTFVGREALLEEYYEKIVNGTQPLILRGEVGSGKTAIMSKLIDHMQKEGKNVFPFFCGMGSMSKNADEFVRQMIYFVETQVGVEHVSLMAEENKDVKRDASNNLDLQQKSQYDMQLEYLHELCGKLTNRAYFYIDALDQLFKDEHIEKLDFLFGTDKVQMIASCTDTFELSSVIVFRTNQMDISKLTIEDAKLVAEGILYAESRDYFDELEKALLGKKCIGSPLYISLLIQRLNMMDHEELSQVNTADEIASYGAKVIIDMPDELETAAVAILKNAIQKISRNADGLLLEVVRFLAVSRNGLNLSDLRAIFKARGQELPALDISLLMKYLDSFFYTREEDRINFTHKVIRTGILREIADQTIYETEIKEYIKILDENEVLYLQEGMYFARITRDYDFAVALMSLVCKTASKTLLKAITEEAVSDEGEFYSLLLFMKRENFEVVKKCLMEFVKDNLQLSKKEMETKLALMQCVLHHMKEVHESEPSEQSVRDLYQAYYNVGHVLRVMGQSEKALIYHKKGVECAEKLYENLQDAESVSFLFFSYNGMGNVLISMGRPDEALQYFKMGLKCAEALRENIQEIVSLRVLSSNYENVGHAYLELNKLEEALHYYEKVLKYAEEMHASQPDEDSLRYLSTGYSNIGRILRDSKQPDKALSYYERGVKCAEQLHAIQQNENSLKNLSFQYRAMGRVLYDMDQYKEALSYCEKGVKCREELYLHQQSDSSKRDLVECYDLMGHILIELNRLDEAFAYYEKELRFTEELYATQQNEKHLRDLYGCYNNMGRILRKLDQSEEALSYYEKGLECAEQLYARRQDERQLKDIRASYHYLGDTLRELDQSIDAIKYYEKQLEYAEVLCEVQQNDENIGYLYREYYEMANVLSELGRLDEALAYYEKWIKCAETIYENRQNLDILREISLVCSMVGNRLDGLYQTDKALKYFEKGLACVKEIYKDKQSDIGLRDLFAANNNLAQVLMELNRLEESLKYYKDGLQYLEMMYARQWSEEVLEWLSFCYKNIASALNNLGRIEEALQYYEKGLYGFIELYNKNKNITILKNISVSYRHMASILLKGNTKYEEMLEYSRQNENITGQIYLADKSIPNLREYITALSMYAAGLAKAGKIQEFLEYKTRVIEFYEVLYGYTGLESDREELEWWKSI